MAQPSTRVLKVGLVIDTSLDPNDGVQQYVIAIGQWLASQGHEVHYLAGQTDRRKLNNLHSLSRNVAVRFNRNRTTIPLPAKRAKLKSLLEREQFDILHVQVPYSPFLAQRLIMAAGPRTAIVGTFHIVAYDWKSSLGNRLLKLWLKRSLARFDQMLSVSSAAAAFAKQSYGVDSLVLPNVIDYDRFSRAKPFKDYDDGVLNILFLGRLVARKGSLNLVQAVNRLKQLSDLPKFRLIICGSGPLETRLKRYIQANQLAPLVTLTGYVSETDKPRYYASADVSAFPSSGGESFGIVLLEAMASGRAAVIAGDNPGYRSVLSAQPDMLVKPNDSQALAAKLAELLNDPAKRHNLAKWGQAYSAGFDVNDVGQKLVSIYGQALHKHRGQ